MEQYQVTGMSCAACSARVEKAVSRVPGVTSCSVSLLTNSMAVEGTADEAAIVAAVTEAGYGAKRKAAEPSAARPSDALEALEDHETPKLKRRLIASVGFLLVLMYLSMGHMMWGWPLPGFLEGNHVAMGLTEMLLTIIIMVINQRFFLSGFRSLLHRAPNMDTLVALGSAAAFGYSTYALFAMTAAQLHGDAELVMHYMDEFYFESAAMILTLITVGKMLEARSKGKTTDALKSLMKLAPKTATVVRSGKETVVPIGQVRTGDIFVVRPGETIPVDGVVEEGSSAVNEAALTGESIPVDKAAGDAVSAATLNQSGFLRCRASRVGEDTTLSQIIRMVSDAAATKAPIAKVADRVSGVFVPAVISIALFTFVIWMLVGQTVGYALARAISVLVISCPCALGLATPVAIMVGNGVGAKHGILFKTAASLESAGRVEIVALDKTGTITQGEPEVTDLLPAPGVTEDELLRLANALEQRSEHPLARAVVRRAAGMDAPEVTNFRALPGNGLTAELDGQKLAGGSLAFAQSLVSIPQEMQRTRAVRLAEQGKTPLFFCRSGKLLGMIAVADVIKPDSPQAVRELQQHGHPRRHADRRQRAHGKGHRRAGRRGRGHRGRPAGRQGGRHSPPEGAGQGRHGRRRHQRRPRPDPRGHRHRHRRRHGRRHRRGGRRAHEEPACSDVPAAIRLSRATLRNIHENLFWAFFYNVIGIPLAAGAWIHLLGWTMNPMFGAAAMSLSSFCVVTNALRLNLFRIRSTKHDHKRKNHAKQTVVPAAENHKNHKEENPMEKTMKIEGMMCGHCEARVKKCLEALPGVEKAEVSHVSGTAVLTLSAPVDDALLKKTVEDQGYQVI